MTIKLLTLAIVWTFQWKAPLFGNSGIEKNVTRLSGNFRAFNNTNKIETMKKNREG
jgi:hypothetical protein